MLASVSVLTGKLDMDTFFSLQGVAEVQASLEAAQEKSGSEKG
jgi:hypothetical protein